MRFLSRALRRSFTSAVLVVGATALACGLVGPAAAQQIINGPLKVTDSGPGVFPSGYAIKGITSYSGDAGVFGYGTAQLGETNIDGVVGYVESFNSVGVVGWSSPQSEAGYGVYGYSASGNGVYGQSVGNVYSAVYGTNLIFGGTAIWGDTGSTGQGILGTGMVGVVGESRGNPGTNLTDPGVLGRDKSDRGDQLGVEGLSPNGYAIAALTNTGIGVAASSTQPGGTAGQFLADPGGTGLIAASLEAGAATLGLATGEGGVFYGASGNAVHPAIAALDTASGTDFIGTYNLSNAETFVVQAGTANYSGFAPTGSSDVQISGDLYVQGQVYSLCSSDGGVFPVTSTMVSGHCSPVSNAAAAPVKASNGRNLTAYSSRGTLPTIEDFGEARLVNGQAFVPLESAFASTIDVGRSYLVFTSPEGDCHGLFVASKSPGGFVIRELMGGHSTIAFQYRIVAHPYGDRSTRLPVTSASKPQPLPRNSSILATLPKRAFPQLHGPNISLPKRLSPPTMSASFKR